MIAGLVLLLNDFCFAAWMRNDTKNASESSSTVCAQV